MSAAAAEFGRRLRELRISHGFARARHFAKELGISENRYTRYERGEAEPGIDLIALFCQRLGTTPNDLFGYPLASQANEGAAAPGFAESARPAADGLPVEAPPPRSPDGAAWRLAKEITAFRPKSPGEDGLSDLRETAAAYAELKANPYGTVARFLAQPGLAALPRKTQTHLKVEIERFLRLIERARGDGISN